MVAHTNTECSYRNSSVTETIDNINVIRYIHKRISVLSVLWL